MTTACRSCGAEIIWAETSSGKRIPMDAEPVHPKGLFMLRFDLNDPTPQAVSVASDQAARLYQSHFATCPQAEGWRK